MKLYIFKNHIYYISSFVGENRTYKNRYIIILIIVLQKAFYYKSLYTNKTKKSQKNVNLLPIVYKYLCIKAGVSSLYSLAWRRK